MTERGLPADVEALLQAVCAEQGVAARRHDELRMLLTTPPENWPVCCRGTCELCVDEQTSVARMVLARVHRDAR